MDITEINNKIVERIKNARIEKNKTQEDLGNELNKTRAAISDMERGKVQVSASELYLLTKLLDKPIEYFFGDDVRNNYRDNIIARLREQSPTDLKDLDWSINLIINLKEKEIEARKFPPTEKIPSEFLINFSKTIYPLSDDLDKLRERINKLIEMVWQEMKVRNLKTPKK